MSRSEEAMRNLGASAEAAGIAPERLVFATRVPRVEDHLARYLVADLFLDTWPYNAHTTAADALRAGLPVITCEGQAFPARVAASLLRTFGLPELVTSSLEAYFDLALSLSRSPRRIQKLRQRLASLDGHPAFGPAFTRSLEKALDSVTPARVEPRKRPRPFTGSTWRGAPGSPSTCAAPTRVPGPRTRPTTDLWNGSSS
jgi:predicted O-linked N-acetylglucosamine transferase (SPINDLY family)